MTSRLRGDINSRVQFGDKNPVNTSLGYIGTATSEDFKRGMIVLSDIL